MEADSEGGGQWGGRLTKLYRLYGCHAVRTRSLPPPGAGTMMQQQSSAAIHPELCRFHTSPLLLATGRGSDCRHGLLHALVAWASGRSQRVPGRRYRTAAHGGGTPGAPARTPGWRGGAAACRDHDATRCRY